MIADRIRQRYLQDPLSIRLGGLAADLARIASCAEDLRERDTIISLLDEGKWFAEWMAPDAPLEIQEKLAEIQIQLAIWQRRWLNGRPDDAMRVQAQRWSDELLALSGMNRD